MNHRTGRELALCQSNLKKNAFVVYTKALSSLLRTHSEHSFLKPLSDALRCRDFLKLYNEADSLSKQKYLDATQHLVANQFALLIKKYPWPKSVMDLKPEENAIAQFHSSEKRCGLVNRKFLRLSWDRSRDRFSKEGARAKYWISSVIGALPNYRRVFDSADFGAGASLGVHGDATNYAAKFSAARWSVTPGAYHHGYAAIRNNYHLWEALLPVGDGRLVCYDELASFEAYRSKCHVVEHNKISFVPKTAKIHRGIAIEPLLNGLVQKGIDQEMRKRLLKVNLDLSDQSKNQRFACEGSLDDSDEGFVTIDLKSASDSISIELVRYLLPADWFRLLDRTRSKCYEMNGTISVYSKFCSMGNGFCFPLQTLLFASACFSIGAGTPGDDFVVYGDDIILRKKYAHQLVDLLKNWGFKTNSDKTFLEGPFRESCGADWFGGKDVRPFTLDYALDSIQNVFKFLNLTRRSPEVENFFRDLRPHVVKTLPQRFQFYRPFKGEEDTGIDSLGDEFLTAPSCIFLPRKNKWEWHELVSSPCVDFKTLEDVRNQPWLISVALRGGSSICFGEYKFLPEVVLRNRAQTKVVRKGYVSTSNWLPPPRV